MKAPESFSTRVDAVFGALDGIAQAPGDASGQNNYTSTQPQWSLSRQHVFQTGKEEADSSDAEEDPQAAQHSEGLVNTILDAQDDNLQMDDQGNILQPSLAFCQALDNEQEYDEADAVAGTSLRGYSDPADNKPNRLTEVLDNNVFEQRMRSHQSAAPSNKDHASLMDIDIHHDSHQPGQQGRITRNSVAAFKSAGQPPLPGRKPAAGNRRSRVPLHVQHPEKYTCYVLDEPLVVGGGDKAVGADSQADQVKAARAASSAASLAQQASNQQESREPLPAFGSGIEFRPTKKARQQSTKHSTGTARGQSSTADLMSHDDEEDLDAANGPQLGTDNPQAEASEVHDDMKEAASNAAKPKPRRRQYRTKTDVT